MESWEIEDGGKEDCRCINKTHFSDRGKKPCKTGSVISLKNRSKRTSAPLPVRGTGKARKPAKSGGGGAKRLGGKGEEKRKEKEKERKEGEAQKRTGKHLKIAFLWINS